VAGAIHDATGVRVRDDPITLEKFLDRSHPRNGGRAGHAGRTLTLRLLQLVHLARA
jgi:hypothetical protein